MTPTRNINASSFIVLLYLLEALGDKVLKGQAPPVQVAEARGRILDNHEDHAVGVHLPAGWVPLSHLDGRDAQRPDVDLSQRGEK